MADDARECPTCWLTVYQTLDCPRCDTQVRPDIRIHSGWSVVIIGGVECCNDETCPFCHGKPTPY